MTKRLTANSFTIADGISDDKKPRVQDIDVVDIHDQLQPFKSCVSPSGSIFEGDCNVLSLRNNTVYIGGIGDSKCAICLWPIASSRCYHGLKSHSMHTTTRH